MKLKTTTEDVQPFADAAIGYWLSYTGLDELPDADAQVTQGLTLSTMRIYQDSPNPSGGLDSFDGFASGGFSPSRIYSHHNQYFAHLANPVTIA